MSSLTSISDELPQRLGVAEAHVRTLTSSLSETFSAEHGF